MTAPMARGASGAPSEQPEAKTEMVPASELSVGDLIMFPSSRHTLEITSIVEETNAKEEKTRRIEAVDTQWYVPLSFEVRRRIPEVDSES